MNKLRNIQVITQDGVRGTAEIPENLAKNKDKHILVQLETGERFYIPFNTLKHEQGDRYYLPVNASQLNFISVEEGKPQNQGSQTLLVVPVIAEELDVHKEQIETGHVRLTKKVHEREEEIQQPLTQEEVTVDRVPVGRFVEAPVQVRQEGDTVIIPVMEEVIVVEKRLRLKEEVRVTRQKHTEPQSQNVTLREEEVLVERVDGNDEEKSNNS